MAKYRVEIPGKGTYEVEADGELSEAQAYRAALGQADMQRMADPTSGMSGVDKFRAGMGKAFTDLGRGAKQIIGMDTDAEESRKLDAPLMKTGAGLAGNITGNVVPAAATMFIPGVNTYTGAAAVGGAMGALQPTVGDESRLANTAFGAGSGVVGQGVGNLVGRAIRPVQSTLPPQQQALANEAMRRGIPLTAGQQTGSRPLQIVDSVMENLPFTSGPQLAQKQAQKEAFNRAVGSTFGAPKSSLTPDVMGAAKQRIGQKFTDLSARNTLQADDVLLSQLSNLDDQASRFLTPDVGKVVKNRIDDVLSRVENGAMTGKAYRNLDSELGKAARGAANGDLRNALGELRGSLREAMDRSIGEVDQQAWKGARREYANLMTVAPLAAKSETGDVSGRTLLSAANTANRNAKFGAPSELAELGRVGRAFVSDNIPNSGTAQRNLYQSLLTSAGGTGIGGIGAAATGNDPVQGMLIGGGVTAGGLLAPRAVQALMNSPAGKAYLTKGLMELTPQELQVLTALGRSGGAGLLGYSQQQ